MPVQPTSMTYMRDYKGSAVWDQLKDNSDEPLLLQRFLWSQRRQLPPGILLPYLYLLKSAFSPKAADLPRALPYRISTHWNPSQILLPGESSQGHYFLNFFIWCVSLKKYRYVVQKSEVFSCLIFLNYWTFYIPARA